VYGGHQQPLRNFVHITGVADRHALSVSFADVLCDLSEISVVVQLAFAAIIARMTTVVDVVVVNVTTSRDE
jgi:hypothetical protein